jgi:pimeloyl-ACP methyl ester carboxylesterase
LGFLKEHEVSGSLASFPSQNVKLFLRNEGTGSPILLMHGGPGADHSTLLPLLPLSKRHTLICYDHRCNGRSQGADVETMTWNNLVEDAEAIRNHFGFEKWAVASSASAFIQGSRFLLTRWSAMDRLGNVSCPTLIVAGADDLFFPPEHQREIEKRIRGARLQIVRGAGHNVHMERPDETRALIAGFVQR